MKLNTVLLIGILALAAFLRFYNLGSVPPSASMDEASIGYNAYSVLKTGKDEYGQFPIISQRGYDDWRRSTYLFLVVPFVALFDLNVVSVRLPAVILSVLTVIATYFLVKELFPEANKFSIFNFQFSIGEIAAFLLAISPWHIYISRLGHESNAYLSFFVFGVLFFLQGEKSKSTTKIFLSMVFFILSMTSYYSGQVFIPLLILGLLIIFRKNLAPMMVQDKKNFIYFFILLILIVPVFGTIFSREALIRYQGTSILNHGATWQESQIRERQYKYAVKEKDLLKKVYHSEKIYGVKLLIKGYFSHLNPKWLFTNSGAEPFKAPDTGLLNLWEAPLIVIGIFVLIFSKLIDPKNKKIIFLWFLLAPIPASIATQAPHAMRSYNFLPTWQIFAALGFVYMLYRFIKLRTIILSAFSFVVFISVLSFYKNYFIIFPKEQSSSFQYALSKIIPYVLSQKKNYQKVVFSNRDNLYQSYMFFLYYSKYDPLLYQKQGGTMSGGFAQTHKFEKYEFRPIVWSKDEFMSNALFVGNESDFPQSIDASRVFTNMDGKGVIEVVKRQ